MKFSTIFAIGALLVVPAAGLVGPAAAQAPESSPPLKPATSASMAKSSDAASKSSTPKSGMSKKHMKKKHKAM